ncbi:MAG: precorrin-6y C5,15-methyltransferase (decarboxylating) subunit CbiE [Candidatus Manganitrophaceae bacterium]|nr:MAG: precorrin-6y C5,15-methyltransferase (decarboxylating) subunit CbiE [Candidatus Manganitrophaceae bacterium]
MVGGRNGNHRIAVIGMEGDGLDHLTPDSQRRIAAADLLMGGERHLARLPGSSAERIVIGSNLKEIAERALSGLKEGKRVVVLASGDPLFYGIGAFLIKRIGKERVEIYPAVSAIQLAFARVKEPWQEAALVSLHAKPIENLLPALEKGLIGLFTDETNTPDAIARFLLERGEAGWAGWVCENLGGIEERVRAMTLDEMARGQFASLNVVILKREKPADGAGADRPVRWEGAFGIPDDFFVYRRPKAGLITKKEIRVMSLAEMGLRRDRITWDIGAGSGSVSIELARLCPEGEVFAIEKNREDFELIERNMRRFGIENITAVCERAPAGLDRFPDPNGVFIGGSGGEMAEILSVCIARLRPGGRIVANLITLENLYHFSHFFKEGSWEVSYTLAQVSRSKPILEMVRYEALNPITIAVAKRKGER